MKDDKVVELFGKYEKQLRGLFEFYAKLEDVELNEHMDLNTENLSYRAFIKLSNQMKIAPALLTHDEIVMVYKLIMKQKTESAKDKKRALTYEDFMETLVKITIRGKEKLIRIMSGGSEEELSSKEIQSKSKEGGKKSTALFFDVKEINTNNVQNLFEYLNLNPADKKTQNLIIRLRGMQEDPKKSLSMSMKKSIKGNLIV